MKNKHNSVDRTLIVSTVYLSVLRKNFVVLYIAIKIYLPLMYNVTRLDLLYPDYLWKNNCIQQTVYLKKLEIRILWTSMRAKPYWKTISYDILEIRDKCIKRVIHECFRCFLNRWCLQIPSSAKVFSNG